MEIDDKSLTLFLIECMTRSFEHGIQPHGKPLVPGTTQRGLKNGSMTYLEISSGTVQTHRVEVLIYSEGNRGPVFGMNIVSKLEIEAIQKSALVYTDIQNVLHTARMNGFKRTHEKILANSAFSLFDIPHYHEPAPVMKGGVSGSLHYKETIDDSLDFFGGGEEICFHPDGVGRHHKLVFRSQIQGCRII